MNIPEHGFDIAISFAGEDREIAESLAEKLVSHGLTVFYDRFFQSNLWGKDLYEEISDIYTKRSRYCLIIVSTHYRAKKWTTHERRSAQARAFAQGSEYILPLRIDNTELPGLPETIGYLDLRSSGLDDVVDMILEKLGFTSETELRRRLAAIQERHTRGIEPPPLVNQLYEELAKLGFTERGASGGEPRRYSHVSCCKCQELWRADNIYFCVECQKAFCIRCVWNLQQVSIKDTEFRRYCMCGGRVG